MAKGSYSAGNASYNPTGGFSGGKAGYSPAQSPGTYGGRGFSFGIYGKSLAGPGSYLSGQKSSAKCMYSDSDRYSPLAKGTGYQKIGESIADVMKAYMKLGKAVYDGIASQNQDMINDGLGSIVSSYMQPGKNSMLDRFMCTQQDHGKKEHEPACFNCGKPMLIPGLCSACRN